MFIRSYAEGDLLPFDLSLGISLLYRVMYGYLPFLTSSALPTDVHAFGALLFVAVLILFPTVLVFW